MGSEIDSEGRDDLETVRVSGKMFRGSVFPRSRHTLFRTTDVDL